MTKFVLPLALILSASTSFAAEPGAAYGGSVGALTMATRGVATSADDVRHQGGFATAAAVRWIQVPKEHHKLSAVAY